jgi:Skp family chaperone for outer membrane proteins
MTDQKKQDDGKGGINPVAAAVTGAVIGAGVVVAGAVAVALKDKKNREKVNQTLTNVKKQAVGYIKDMQKEVQDKKDEVRDKLTEGKEKAKRVTKSVKNSLDHAVKDAKKAAH